SDSFGRRTRVRCVWAASRDSVVSWWSYRHLAVRSELTPPPFIIVIHVYLARNELLGPHLLFRSQCAMSTSCNDRVALGAAPSFFGSNPPSLPVVGNSFRSEEV